MKCDFSIELLSGYLDGELDEKQRIEVEKHLKECQVCKDALKELKQVDDYIRTQEFEEPSREFIFGLNRRIAERIKKKTKSRFFVFRYTPVFAPAAVAILILVVLINLSQQKRLIGIDDRILYAEIAVRKKLDLQIPEPKVVKGLAGEVEITTKKETERLLRPAISLEIAKRAESFDELNKPLRKEELVELEIPKDRIIRAIVDSTGKVLKVATGNSILPEKDTMLENRLQGQQLTPPIVAGQKTQIYVDFTQTKKENH